MLVYVIEYDNPHSRPFPDVVLDGEAALRKVKAEYEAQMEELGTNQEKADAGYGEYGCYWRFEEGCIEGSALIAADEDADRWEWRITSHEITV